MHNIVGCLAWTDYHFVELNALLDFGLIAKGPYTTNLTYNTLKSNVDSGAVMLLDLKVASGPRHNVVAYGYHYDGSGDSKNFYFMDPNKSSSLTISSFPASGTVYVSTSGYNFYVECFITAK